MRYRGGGIGHTYMREIENRFEDMKLEQSSPQDSPRATQPPRDADSGASDPSADMASASAGKISTDSDSDGHVEGDSEDEWVDAHPGEND